MPPVVAFHLGNRRDVASTKGGDLGGHQDQDQPKNEQSAAEAEPRETHSDEATCTSGLSQFNGGKRSSAAVSCVRDEEEMT